MSNTSIASRVLRDAEEYLALMSMVENRASSGEWPMPESVGDYMAWIDDEIQDWRHAIDHPPQNEDHDPLVLAADIAYCEELLVYLEKLGFQKRPLPWQSPYAHMEYSEGGELHKIHLAFDEPQAHGQLTLEMSGYGPYVFNPKWSRDEALFLIDLYYDSPSFKESNDGNLSLIDRLAGTPAKMALHVFGVGGGDPLAYVRFWPQLTLVELESGVEKLTTYNNLPVYGYRNPEAVAE